MFGFWLVLVFVVVFPFCWDFCVVAVVGVGFGCWVGCWVVVGLGFFFFTMYRFLMSINVLCLLCFLVFFLIIIKKKRRKKKTTKPTTSETMHKHCGSLSIPRLLLLVSPWL